MRPNDVITARIDALTEAEIDELAWRMDRLVTVARPADMFTNEWKAALKQTLGVPDTGARRRRE